MEKPTFIEYFSEKVRPVKVVKKEDSKLMRLAAWCLALLTKMKIVDFPVERFMEQYITVVNHTIYVPSTRTMKESTTLHELTHVLQSDRVWNELQYLLSKKWRSYFESSADQAWMIVWPEKATDERFEQKANSFVRYGIPRDTIVGDLKKRRQEVQDHDTQPEPKTVAHCYIEWMQLP